MAASMASSSSSSSSSSLVFFLLYFCSVSSLLELVSSSSSLGPSSSSSSVCHPQPHLFLHNLQSQCPLSFPRSSAIEVDGASLDRALHSNNGNAYTAILFYASWCPFSRHARSIFDILSSKFPQIVHLAVEQSSVMPSVFSRYGIHCMPSLLMVDKTARVRYHGPKDLDSVLHFYERLTGLDAVEYFKNDQPRELGISEKAPFWLLSGITRKEILGKEPYLVLSILFLILRALLYVYPRILNQLRDFWGFFVPHLNFGIFGETSQLLGRILHLIDVKRIWGKIGLCKKRNFQQRAKNARVWASSLASVSLGESSSVRSSSVADS